MDGQHYRLEGVGQVWIIINIIINININIITTYRSTSMARPNRQTFSGESYVEGIRSQIDRGSLVTSDWIVKNFTHPKNDRIPWSYEDHEFQIAIANCGDTDQNVWVRKCAQIGLSTLQINLVLAFCAMSDFSKAAYVMPTAKFATEFSAMRMGPAILGSPVIRELVANDTDNTGTKKIGTCFLVMRGTSGETAAISIDLDMLVVDELDFCNQKVLSTFSSRLQHSKLKLRRNFSTPTLPAYGISAGYDGSTQGLRAVFCDHCSKWTFPSFFSDVVIPGFDKPISMYRSGDHLHYGVREAYLACPACKGELTTGNLNNPDKREWVHQYSDRADKGFQVMPWDVPTINTIQEVLTSIKDYTYSDWVNMRLGLPHASEENSIVLETVRRNAVIPPASLTELLRGTYKGVFMGSDLGKTNHYAVGVPNKQLGTLDVIFFGRIDTAELVAHHGESTLGPFLKELFIKTWCNRIVVDHMPEWNTALLLHAQLPIATAFGAYYVGDRAGSLDCYDFKPDKGVVNIRRDDHFDDVVAAINTGKIRFPYIDSQEMAKVLAHLEVLKKVKQVSAKGIATETWTSTSTEDHYAHALGYLWCAYASVEDRFTTSVPLVAPSVSTVRVRG